MVNARQLRALLHDPELLAEAAAGDLRTAERLRARWPADLVAAASELADLRSRAVTKFNRADRMVFTRHGLEQASGEATARHRARRFAGIRGTVVDLCCGLGGDLIALSSYADYVIGVDRDETQAVAARHNSEVYDVAAAVVVSDVEDLRLTGLTAAFVDPARRSTKVGTDRRGGYTPPLSWSLALPLPRVAVKAAPGIDHSVVPDGWELEFVAVGRELKEAVLWSPAWSTAARRATVIPQQGGADDAVTLVADPSTPAREVRPPGRYLLDPSPAVTRAGAVADLANMLDAEQIDRRVAFLTADHPLASPLGRGFLVEASLPFSVKALAAELRRLDVGTVDIRRRGLAGDVDELRRRLRPSGSRRATVMLTRVVNKPWTLVCTDLAGT